MAPLSVEMMAVVAARFDVANAIKVIDRRRQKMLRGQQFAKGSRRWCTRVYTDEFLVQRYR
jgi:hypothetical protein